jgi:hypothetical protein
MMPPAVRGAECVRRSEFQLVAWSAFMSVYAIVSKVGLFPRRRARLVPARGFIAMARECTCAAAPEC